MVHANIFYKLPLPPSFFYVFKIGNPFTLSYIFVVTIQILQMFIFLLSTKVNDEEWCEELLHTFTTKICTHNKNPVGSGTTM